MVLKGRIDVGVDGERDVGIVVDSEGVGGLSAGDPVEVEVIIGNEHDVACEGLIVCVNGGKAGGFPVGKKLGDGL